ncbi:hypothetical protein [Streptomyces sp. NPDC090025]|uniref:hypothetical protein n=1 Tax=Streptomyces sp. NPDC090025 TaxID=3365922 RepID=UPI0038378AEB
MPVEHLSESSDHPGGPGQVPYADPPGAAGVLASLDDRHVAHLAVQHAVDQARVRQDRADPESVRHDTTARFIASSRTVVRQSLAMLEGLIDHLEHMAARETGLAADLKAAEQALLKSLSECDRLRLVSAHHEAVSARLCAEVEYGRANGQAAELEAELRDAESARERALEELHEVRQEAKSLQLRHEESQLRARRETEQARAVTEARNRELVTARSVHSQEIMQVSKSYQLEIDSLRRALETERSRRHQPAGGAPGVDVGQPPVSTRTVVPTGP